jgi:hypothetical protein
MRNEVSATGLGVIAALLFWVMAAAPCAAHTLDRAALSHHTSCYAMHATVRERVKHKGCEGVMGARRIKHRASVSPSAPSAFPLISIAFTQPAQPRMCESPMRSLSPNVEMYAGLRCDDDSTATTALDGFARLPHHIAFRQ